MDKPKLPSVTPLGSADGPDHRRAPRIPIDCGVSFASASNFYTGFTSNISEGGVFVATHDLLPVGTQVSLRFTLPGSDVAIRCTGEVRWQRTAERVEDEIYPGVGVRFTSIAPEDAKRIREFIAQREPLFHPDA